MPRATESSALTKLIREQQQPPILGREHGVETVLVRNPYFNPTEHEPDRPIPFAARTRTRAPRRAVGFVVAALFIAGAAVALALWLRGKSDAEAARVASSPIGVVEKNASVAIPVAIPVALAAAESEPVVIAVSETESPSDAAGSKTVVNAVAHEGAEAADDSARSALAEKASNDRLDARTVESGGARSARAVARNQERRRARRRSSVPSRPVQKGTLMVASKPPCRILIDGKDTGMTTPQRAIGLRPGVHVVTLRNEKYSINSTSKVKVESGASVRLVKDLSHRIQRRKRRDR